MNYNGQVTKKILFNIEDIDTLDDTTFIESKPNKTIIIPQHQGIQVYRPNSTRHDQNKKLEDPATKRIKWIRI